MVSLLDGQCVRWFRSAGGVLTSTDFHLQMLEARSEIGFDEKVKDLAATRLWIVLEQTAVAACT